MGLSTVARRRYSLIGAAIVIYTIFIVLQFIIFLQHQEKLTARNALEFNIKKVRDQVSKKETLREFPVHRANLTTGTIGTTYPDAFNNDSSLEQGNKELVSSTRSTLLDVEKIDWNDYAFYAKEAKRKGPGEHGKSVIRRLPGEKKEISQKLFSEYRYNAYVSDQISVERATKDTRTKSCKTQHFIKDIPENSVSVIIVFHNERNSTLLRTVHSVVNRSPARLLREIILVDDLSVKEELKEILDSYITKHFKKVKIIRNSERLGLIRSRITGADASSGTFLVFFDAHIEVNSNYLPPLLEPMIINYRTIACPVIDIITDTYFNILHTYARMRGVFDWTLTHKMFPVEKKMDETTPHQNPVMVGCAFAITRDWWEELEKYDLGLQIWGGEQFELSFKSWMCGGSVVDAPCSRVAHLFRPLPYVSEVVKDNRIDFNLLRVASVWMDEYKGYVVQRRPPMNGLDPGNLTRQFELKKKLNCKSFDWYLNNIAPEILQRYPTVEPPDIAWGYLRNSFNNTMCLMNADRDVLLKKCDIEAKHSFFLNWRYHISFNDKCWVSLGPKRIFTYECTSSNKDKTQQFAWNRNSGQIVSFNTHLCVDFDFNTSQVSMTDCDMSKNSQSWKFDYYNKTLVDNLWEKYKATRVH